MFLSHHWQKLDQCWRGRRSGRGGGGGEEPLVEHRDYLVMDLQISAGDGTATTKGMGDRGGRREVWAIPPPPPLLSCIVTAVVAIDKRAFAWRERDFGVEKDSERGREGEKYGS